jgi:4-(2-carboxyphenyl)-2-oxobut-3-enoate aldolase
MARLSAADIRGVVGIVPTPAKEGANRWDAVQTVNLEETARMVEALVEAGIDVIMTNGTFGEGASLTWDEVQAFVDTIVQVVRKRVPVFAGATTLNTRDTIARGRALRDLGADGLFVGRPMWIALDDRGIVQFYRDLAEALPDMALVIYDNPGAFKGKISAAVYRELSRIPQIVASKHIGLLGGMLSWPICVLSRGGFDSYLWRVIGTIGRGCSPRRWWPVGRGMWRAGRLLWLR